MLRVSDIGMSMRSIDALLIGTYDLPMHLWTMAVPWPMGYGGKPSSMEKLVEKGKYMLLCLHVYVLLTNVPQVCRKICD